MGRMFVIALGSLIVACQTETHAVSSPVPSPSPHTVATAAVLQSQDVPASVIACPGSGPIDVYLTALSQSNPGLVARVADRWLQLRNEGAQSGAISIFAAAPAACSAELGAAGGTRAVASFVARFGDDGQADRAWQAGVFGFTPPPSGVIAPGVVRGTATGLGLTSFTYDRPSVRLACWRRSVFVALVVVSNMDAGTFSAATSAIDPRLN